LIYIGLAEWNCRMHRVINLFGLIGRDENISDRCGTPSTLSSDLPKGLSLTTWRSTDIRVSNTTTVMAGFVLPMLLGCLGGCAYALRKLDHKLINWTLEPHDGKHALVRVGLAALLGGLVGVIWTSDAPVKLGAFSLSLAAVAFFVGFSVEVVFKVIENLIDGVSATIRGPASASPIVTQSVPSPTRPRAPPIEPALQKGASA
jgi:hypothetical protein